MQTIQSNNVFPNPGKAQMRPEFYQWMVPLFILFSGMGLVLLHHLVITATEVSAAIAMTGMGMMMNRYRRAQKILMTAVFMLIAVYIFMNPMAILIPFNIIGLQLLVALFVFKSSPGVFKWIGKAVAVMCEIAIIGRVLELFIGDMVNVEVLYYACSEVGLPGMSIHMAVILTVAGYWMRSKGIYDEKQQNVNGTV